jgi:hypothetical protein
MDNSLANCVAIIKQDTDSNIFPFMQGVNASIEDILGTSEVFTFDEEDTSVFSYCALNEGTVRTKTLDVTGSPWVDIETELRPAIDLLIQSGEENGAVSDFGSALCACRAVLRLVAVMKAKLCNSQWGDNAGEVILGLIKDAREIISVER